MKRRSVLAAIGSFTIAGCTSQKSSHPSNTTTTTTTTEPKYKTNESWKDFSGLYEPAPYKIHISRYDNMGTEHGIKLIISPKNEQPSKIKKIVKLYFYDENDEINTILKSDPVQITSPTQLWIMSTGTGPSHGLEEYFKIHIVESDQ